MPDLSIPIGEIAADFESLLADIPKLRRGLHEELADVLKSQLDSSISTSINDSHGTIAGWQRQLVGSGGGYAAIRPVAGISGPDSPGAITNYLESGHKTRPPGGNNPRYRPRIKLAYVSGRHFYLKTVASVEPILISTAEAYADKLAARIEGGR